MILKNLFVLAAGIAIGATFTQQVRTAGLSAAHTVCESAVSLGRPACRNIDMRWVGAAYRSAVEAAVADPSHENLEKVAALQRDLLKLAIEH